MVYEAGIGEAGMASEMQEAWGSCARFAKLSISSILIKKQSPHEEGFKVYPVNGLSCEA